MLLSIWRKGTLIHCWWECKLVQPLWKAVWSFLIKLKIKLRYDPAIPLLGIHPEEVKTGYQRDIWNHMFIAIIFTVDKICKQYMCLLTDKRIKMLICICIYVFVCIYICVYTNTHTMGSYLAIRKREVIAICDNTNGSWGHYAKWNKVDKERQILHVSLIYGI